MTALTVNFGSDMSTERLALETPQPALTSLAPVVSTEQPAHVTKCAL